MTGSDHQALLDREAAFARHRERMLSGASGRIHLLGYIVRQFASRHGVPVEVFAGARIGNLLELTEEFPGLAFEWTNDGSVLRDGKQWKDGKEVG